MAGVEAIDAALQAGVEDGTFPGAVLAVRHQGALVYERAVGQRSLFPPSTAATTQTLYDLASLTKPLATTTAIVFLAQQGRLTLESRVDEWIEALRGAALGSVTLIHLLTHSSGLPGWRPFYERLSANGVLPEGGVDHERAREAVIAYIRDESLLYPPGTRSLYSDLGFMLLGFIVERITNASLALFCERQLFEPIGAAPLAFFPDGINGKGRFDGGYPIAATEHDPWRGRLLCGEVHDENAFALGGIAGHAGLFGTARAVLAISSAWLSAYEGRQSILDADLVRRCVTRYTPVPHSSWALGWDTPSAPSSAGTCFSDSSFGHLGYTGTSLWIDPACRLEVALLSNRVHPSRRNERIKQFRPHIHDVVYQTVVGTRRE
ncbi:MAG: serine hydrolase domain-containing protein [Nitrospiraceae bacterium]